MKQFFCNFFAVGGAGFLGAVLRWGVGQWLNTTFLPWGTLLINISGSLFLGWFSTLITQRIQVSDTTRLAIAVGFVGAYTTFSSFMFETDQKFRDGSFWIGFAYLAASIILGLLAVRVGVVLAQPH